MIKTSAVAKASFVGVAGSELGIFNVLFGFFKFVVPPEEVNEFGQDWVLIWFFFQHALELFHGFVVLVVFQQNFSQNRPCLIIFWVHLQQHPAQLFASLVVALPQLQIGQHFESFLVFFEFFEALVQHEYGRVNVFLVIVGVFGNLKENVGFCESFFFGCSSFAPNFFDDDFLELSCGLDVLSGFFVDAVIVGTLFFDVELIELEIGLNVLLQSLSRTIFFSEYFASEELFGPVVPFQLDAEFGEVQD